VGFDIQAYIEDERRCSEMLAQGDGDLLDERQGFEDSQTITLTNRQPRMILADPNESAVSKKAPPLACSGHVMPLAQEDPRPVVMLRGDSQVVESSLRTIGEQADHILGALRKAATPQARLCILGTARTEPDKGAAAEMLQALVKAPFESRQDSGCVAGAEQVGMDAVAAAKLPGFVKTKTGSMLPERQSLHRRRPVLDPGRCEGKRKLRRACD
jgi:hypothetical protein